jgi:hypothetical protein
MSAFDIDNIQVRTELPFTYVDEFAGGLCSITLQVVKRQLFEDRIR